MRPLKPVIFTLPVIVMSLLLNPVSVATAGNAHSNSDQCDYLPGPHDAETVTADGDGITSAWYGNRTEIYGHGVLGDAVEAHTLYAHISSMSTDDCALQVTLDDSSVFEDVTPRIADVTGDGVNDVITIESHQDRGASLAIYGIKDGTLHKLVATPYIGQSYRWLAPVGTADFNKDGSNDVAFVQTPHLAGILQIWSFKDASAKQLAASAGFSNHRIGENFITGGIANCDGQAVIVIPDRRWRSTMAATFSDGTIHATEVASAVSGDTISRHLLCQ